VILCIVRHGKAEDADATIRDEDRPLTPRGIEQARYLAHELSALGHSPDQIVSSSYSRAVATARVIHQAVRCRFELSTSLECGHAVSEVVELIEELGTSRSKQRPAVKSLMLVGHNPQLGELCTVLTHGLAGSEMMLRTGEAVCLLVRPGDLIGAARVLARVRLEDACVGSGRA